MSTASTSPITGDSGSDWTGSSRPFTSTYSPLNPTSASIPLSDIQPVGYDATITDDGSSFPANTGNSVPNNSGNSGLATSAALYLYTFLATLILLLIISAAIVIRSYILRRRSRLMIEEAIRNGTWIAPFPPEWDATGRGRAKVDLSKKPKMWEAFIGEVVTEHKEQTVYVNNATGDGHVLINSTWRADGSQNQWYSIWPFAASYLVPSERVDSSRANVNRDEVVREGAPGVTRRLRLHPRMRFTRFPIVFGSSDTPTEAVDVPSTTGTNNAIPMQDLHQHYKHFVTPTPMRVAAIIKMPTPPARPTTLSTSSSRTASASGTLSSAHPSTLSSTSTRTPPEGDEAPLPHVELGVAEVILLPRLRDDENDYDSVNVTESDVTERTRGSESVEG